MLFIHPVMPDYFAFSGHKNPHAARSKEPLTTWGMTHKRRVNNAYFMCSIKKLAICRSKWLRVLPPEIP